MQTSTYCTPTYNKEDAKVQDRKENDLLNNCFETQCLVIKEPELQLRGAVVIATSKITLYWPLENLDTSTTEQVHTQCIS